MIMIIREAFHLMVQMKYGHALKWRSIMSSWSWKAGLASIAIVAVTAYAGAQMSGHPVQGQTGPGDSDRPTMSPPGGAQGQMHARMMQMMQGGIMPGGMRGESDHHGMMGMHGGLNGQRTMPGQDAFGAIQEVVQILESDPTTDWSKVNIGALRDHLVDMNEVTLHAATTERPLDDGVEIAVTGEGRTLEAIKRMVPAHVSELVKIGWNAKTDDLPNGVKLTVTTNDAKQAIKLKALGFMGIMVQGGHHQPHHLMIAKGEFPTH
jgi:hypothetical protein